MPASTFPKGSQIKFKLAENVARFHVQQNFQLEIDRHSPQLDRVNIDSLSETLRERVAPKSPDGESISSL